MNSKKGNQTAVWVAALIFGMTMTACGGETNKESPEDTDATDSLLPDMRGLDISNIGKDSTSLGLTEERDCSGDDSLGVFGLALGPACSLAPVASDILYGSAAFNSQNNALSCASYDPSKEDQGLLKALLCEKAVLKEKNIESIRFTENGKDVGISFLDYDSSDTTAALGTWTAKGPDAGRYPANIRFWTQESKSELEGVLAMNLASATSGAVYFDFNPQGSKLSGGIEFVAATSTSNCKSAPSVSNCHFEDISIKGDENTAGESVPGFRLRILANDRTSAGFMALEGKYRLNEATAKAWFADPSLPESFRTIRGIYFRMIQQGKQVWGSFDFKDGNGNTISASVAANSDQIDLGKLMRDGFSEKKYSGVCQNIGSKDITTCSDIDGSKYDSLWLGDEKLVAPAADYVLPVDFSGAPSTNGVVKK